MKISFASFAICALMTGCAAQPVQSDSVLSQAGPPPSIEAADAAIRGYLLATLKDPDSLKQYRMTTIPTAFSWYRGLLHGGGDDAAWLVCFEYNAKNSYGGYTGVKSEGYAMKVTNNVARVINYVNWPTATRRC